MEPMMELKSCRSTVGDAMRLVLVAMLAMLLGLLGGLAIGHRISQGIPLGQVAGSTATAQERSVTVTPSRTTFKGEGEKTELEVKAWRVFSPFGMSPTEMISHVKAYEEQGGQAPGIAIGDDGVATTEAVRGSAKASGLSWTLWDAVKSFLRRVMWWGIGGAGLLLALYLIPATKPIASMILRGLAAVVPVLGSLVERIVARFKWQKPLEQTVAGVQAVKEGMTEAERQAVNQKLQAVQDEATQAVIRQIKAG